MKQIGIVMIGLVLGGCSMHEQALNSKQILPSAYSTEVAQEENEISPQWWEKFNIDPLNALVEEALVNNHDILMAYERLEQARTQVRIAEANVLPFALTAQTSARGVNADGVSTRSEASSLSLNVAYEVDFWGKVAAQTRMAQTSYMASQYDLDTLRLSLSAGVVEYYLRLAALQKRVTLAKENVQIAQQLLTIVTHKEAEGLATQVDINRQNSSLLQNTVALVALQSQAKQTANALALLAGKAPQEFEVPLVSFDEITPLRVGPGIPSELLVRRPDIASMMAKLKNAEDAIIVASAQRFPSFKLTGNTGLASTALLSLSNPLTSVLEGVLAYTLFDGGNIKEALNAARSRGNEALLAYEKTILTALKEVEDALLDQALSTQQLALQEEILALEKTTLAQSTLLYQEGVSDYATLLDAQRSFYQAQDQRATQLLSLLSATVTLHKVLGGGWEK